MKKRALVTGATGFIGSHIVRRLVAEGHHVAILARPSSSMVRIADVVDKVIVLTADIGDVTTLQKQIEGFSPEWIFHMANAGLAGGVSVPDDEVVRVNLIGLVTLLRSLERTPYEAFINGGSSAEYGAKQAPMKEADLCEPLTPYAVSKLAATAYAAMYARLHQKPIITFRIFSPFGPFDDERRLVSTASRSILANKELTVVPGVVRDYLPVEELAGLFIEAAERLPGKKELCGEIFNAGSGAQQTARRVVEIIAAAVGHKPMVKWSDAAARSWESPVWQADMHKTFSHFSWRPKVSFEQGITSAVEWYRKNPQTN